MFSDESGWNKGSPVCSDLGIDQRSFDLGYLRPAWSVCRPGAELIMQLAATVKTTYSGFHIWLPFGLVLQSISRFPGLSVC